MRGHGSMQGHTGAREDVVVRRHMLDRGDHDRSARRYVRIERGHRVPGEWMDRRFHIGDFNRYGLYPPMHGGRWIRYHDDALLVDPYGEVIDGQWDMDWDGYDSDRMRGHHGMAEYESPHDYDFDEDGYEWAEDERDLPGHGYDRPAYEHPGYQGPGYGSGYGGHGYYYPQAGAIVITETITTTAPVVEEKVWYEDVEVREKPRVHKRKHRTKVRPGERG